MSATPALKVMLVEDHAAFREALALLLSHNPEIEVVVQAGSLTEAREAIAGGLEEHLDIAVVDLGLPDGDGRELFAELRRANPGISVVVLSATIEAGHIDDLLRAGADAVLDKVESPLTITEEIRQLGGV